MDFVQKISIISTVQTGKKVCIVSVLYSTVKLDLKTFLVITILVLSQVLLILTVLKANLVKLVIGDLVLKVKLVLILTVLKVKFDCNYYKKSVSIIVIVSSCLHILGFFFNTTEYQFSQTLPAIAEFIHRVTSKLAPPPHSKVAAHHKKMRGYFGFYKICRGAILEWVGGYFDKELFWVGSH